MVFLKPLSQSHARKQSVPLAPNDWPRRVNASPLKVGSCAKHFASVELCDPKHEDADRDQSPQHKLFSADWGHVAWRAVPLPELSQMKPRPDWLRHLRRALAIESQPPYRS